MKNPAKPLLIHPIQVVSRRTGLNVHLLRAWEKRYGAVAPLRTPARRRLYSEGDIERLLLLRRVTRGGHSIGQVARLPLRDLRSLLESDAGAARRLRVSSANEHPAARQGAPESPVPRDGTEDCLGDCLESVRKLDIAGLEGDLGRASLAFGNHAILENLLAPLLRRVGDEWHQGSMRIAHEHLLSGAVRSFVGQIAGQTRVASAAPRLLAGTPAGQNHELGALFASATASSEGWRAIYLGPNLPAEEIAAVAARCGARAVALSLSYPSDDPRLGGELLRLRRLLPRRTAIVVGGSAAGAYSRPLKSIGVRPLPDMRALRTALRELRRSGRS